MSSDGPYWRPPTPRGQYGGAVGLMVSKPVLEWFNLDEWPKTSREWPTSSSATAPSPAFRADLAKLVSQMNFVG
jgi:hypothetical protein